MRMSFAAERRRGLTLIELLVVLGVIALLAVLLLPSLSKAENRAVRIACVNNLKQTGISFRIWSGNHGDEFPQAIPVANGGTMEFATGPNLFRHFQAMSNELSTPKILLCPAEYHLGCATNFDYLRNSNLSYFVGVDARGTNATMILSGDRSITNGLPLKNGILELTKDGPARWTPELHDGDGNILLADISVSQVNNSGLQDIVAHTGIATNRLQMPVLGQ